MELRTAKGRLDGHGMMSRQSLPDHHESCDGVQSLNPGDSPVPDLVLPTLNVKKKGENDVSIGMPWF